MTGEQNQPARRRLGEDQPCPCDSGKIYGHCCSAKEFDYITDDKGNIFKSIPLPPELAAALEEQKQKFIREHGQEPGPGDEVFFDLPPFEHVEHEMVEDMKAAGIDPALIYAFEKTGLLVTEANEHLIADKDLAEWEAAIEEYRAKHGEDDDDELV